jgi:hypothetical protein
MKVLIILGIFLVSCGVYKYEYKKNKKVIVSKNGNPITLVIIKNVNREVLAQFEAISEKPNREFSLMDFSPDKFESMNNLPFYFENGNIYLLEIHPVADRVLPPIIIKIEPSGQMVELKHL